MKTKFLAILFSVFIICGASAQRTTVPDDLQITKVELGTGMDSIGVLDSKKVLKYIPQTTLLDRAELQIQPKLDFKENLSNKVTDFSIVNHTKYPSVQAVQTELANFINNSQKAVPNGVASLDVSGKIPMAQIPDALVGSVSYQGNYDALANTPTLAESPAASTKGHYYVVTQPGTQFGETYSLGDWIISNGVEWQKVDNNNDVASVFGRKGVVVPLESDYENFYFKKAGGNITGNTVIDPLNSNTNIAGSNLTLKKQSTSTSTNVSQFIDVDRQVSSTPPNLNSTTYGLVSRVVNSSTVEDAGFSGSNLVGRNSSSNNFNFAYGTINSAEALGSGNGNFVTSTVNRSSVTGAAIIDYLRGTGTTTTIDNASATVNYMQGAHNSLVFESGSVGDATVCYLDIDAGSATVTGDLAYIRSGNDILPTVNGNSYFIKSESTLPSEFSGDISAPNFIGNGSLLTDVDAVRLTTYNLGANLFTTTVTDCSDNTMLSGIYRANLNNTANIPVAASGVLYHQNIGENGYVVQMYHPASVSDNVRLYIRHYKKNVESWSPWVELYHTGNFTPDNYLEKTDFYEEGTSFTPTISGYTFTITDTEYVRKGNDVLLTFVLTNLNGSGALDISGLPFTTVGSDNYGGVIFELRGSNLSSADISRLRVQSKSGVSGLVIKYIDDSVIPSGITMTNGVLSCTISYKTNVYTP